MLLLLLALLFITETTGASSQIVARNIDLKRNIKDPGKIVDIQLKLFATICTIHLYSVDKVNSYIDFSFYYYYFVTFNI